jgi:formylglycine-generating enzyme required for sulfatase activity
VLKALAKDKSLRYSSASAFSDDIQLFLEGEKERERNHRQAMAKVAEGKALVEKMERLRVEVKEAENAADKASQEIMPFWPIEKKEGFWAALKQLRKMRDDVVKSFSDAQGAFQEALGFERRNPEARAALADMYWAQYLRREETRHRAEMVLYDALVRQYNDGQYDERLKGDGTLAVTTRHYACPCLTKGRWVAPDEMDAMGYNPFSGRAIQGWKWAEGLPELEPKDPVHLKVHGEACKTEPLEGADVWLYRYEENKRTLLPVFPGGVEAKGAERRAVPDSVLEGCFEKESPYRPGEGVHLGKTPVARFKLPMGSYLLILHKRGFHPVRRPVLINRLANEEVDVTLYRDGEVPEGFVQIPAGRFISEGDWENPYSRPKEIREIGDAFIARFPVTCREYLEFLNDVAAKDPEQTALRVPRKALTAGFYWPRDGEGRYHIPTERWLSEAPEDLKEAASKLDYSPIWWDENWPAFSITWDDLMAYVGWKTMKDGFLFSLPLEIPWEKSARGTDGRFYPWGNDMDSTFCNMVMTHEEGMRPYPVNSYPLDESPYGVRGLAGNVRDPCLNDVGEAHPGWRGNRGGDWTSSGFDLRSACRAAFLTSHVGNHNAGRLAWFPVCKVPKPG